MFGDRDVLNSFDSLFDFDRDGSLDIMESSMQLEFLSNNGNSGSYEVELDPELDRDELEMMDPDERSEALEDAGYDVDEFDFD